jgi:hypothetical protein
MTLPLQTVSDATPESLTALLEAAGLLSGERVTNVRIEASDAFNSTIAHLELHFGSPRSPMKLLLKLNCENAGREEVAFYDLVSRVEGDTTMLVPCLNATFDPTSGASHLPLRDVSETHEAPVTREKLLGHEGVPTTVQLRAVIEALARLHATFWEHPLLDKHTAAQLTERYRSEAAFGAWWDKHRL